MGTVTLDKLRAYANTLDGQTLVTRVQSCPFTLRVTPKGLVYTPTSTGTPRLQRWRYIERILDRFNENRSLSPTTYKDISKNASYILAVLGKYIDSLPAPRKRFTA